MTAGLPARLQGGWRRVSIAVGDEPAREGMDVWWLQAPTKHADLRTPLGAGAEDDVLGFAGTTTWDGAWVTWTPDLTLVPSDRPDTGRATWDGDDLLEAGTFAAEDGSEVPYVERWRRLPGSDAPFLALSTAGGRLVRTGSYAITVLDTRASGGDFAAVAWRLSDGGWTADRAYPPGATAPPPPVAVQGSTVVLDDGLTWTVDEISD